MSNLYNAFPIYLEEDCNSQTKKNTIAKANIPATSSDVAGNNSSKPEELSSASAKKVSKFLGTH